MSLENIVVTKTTPLAGKPATPAMLVDVARLITTYYSNVPDVAVAGQRVAFGTSVHRGSAFDNSFNERHILAISQATCDYRRQQGIDGPLFMGIDTHALSEPAFASVLEVLADGLQGVKRISFEQARRAATTRRNRAKPGCRR